jgi:hypothetical protein
MMRLGWVIAATLPLLDGRVLANDEKDAEAEDHPHEGLQLIDLPTAVQETFRTEASGGIVEELHKEERQGQVIYEGEIVKGRKATDLEVGSDGKVLRRGEAHDESQKRDQGQD